MSLLIESIKLLDGKFFNLAYHEARMKRSLKALFGKTGEPELEKFLRESGYPTRGLYKCRIVYDADGNHVSFDHYVPRPVSSVRLIKDDDIKYPFKYVDREAINKLFAMRAECDDVMIISHGKVTDCSYSNIVFRKNREWFTPERPLLPGTMRQKLIDENKVVEREILVEHLRSFDGFKLINAMLEFESAEIEVSKIVF